MPTRVLTLALSTLTFMVVAGRAPAALVNLYTFDGNVNDSVGGKNGTIIDPGTATAFFGNTGGKGYLDLTGNTGQSSNAITQDAYVNLPNGLITTAANGGTSGAFTISVWASVSVNRPWAEIYSFGTSNGGEDTSASGSTSPYLALVPDTDLNFTLRSTTHSASSIESFVGTANNTPLSTGVMHNLVTVYNQSAGLPGTITFYLDGTLVGSNSIASGLSLNTNLNDVNNWLGRSQWTDPVFAGRIGELAVYNTALTPTEVSVNFTAGEVPEPATATLGALGLVLGLARRKRQRPASSSTV